MRELEELHHLDDNWNLGLNKLRMTKHICNDCDGSLPRLPSCDILQRSALGEIVLDCDSLTNQVED